MAVKRVQYFLNAKVHRQLVTATLFQLGAHCSLSVNKTQNEAAEAATNLKTMCCITTRELTIAAVVARLLRMSNTWEKKKYP